MTSDTTKAAFADFRDDLDDGYDRRERLIKVRLSLLYHVSRYQIQSLIPTSSPGIPGRDQRVQEDNISPASRRG
jgi:hypothetical protein